MKKATRRGKRKFLEQLAIAAEEADSQNSMRKLHLMINNLNNHKCNRNQSVTYRTQSEAADENETEYNAVAKNMLCHLSVSKIKKAFSKLKKNRAVDVDEISTEILRIDVEVTASYHFSMGKISTSNKGIIVI